MNENILVYRINCIKCGNMIGFSENNSNIVCPCCFVTESVVRKQKTVISTKTDIINLDSIQDDVLANLVYGYSGVKSFCEKKRGIVFTRSLIETAKRNGRLRALTWREAKNLGIFYQKKNEDALNANGMLIFLIEEIDKFIQKENSRGSIK